MNFTDKTWVLNHKEIVINNVFTFVVTNNIVTD